MQHLFQAIRRAASTAELKSDFVPLAARHFEATRSGLMIFAEMPLGAVPAGVLNNPVARYLLERHAPVHEGVLLKPGQWQAICRRTDHGHVLAGPIIAGGELIGVLALTRSGSHPAFNDGDMAALSGLCAHLSAWFGEHSKPAPAGLEALTPRERQIAGLVREGLTNAQIGERLCISAESVKAALKRVFRKTGITSRAQLAARVD